MPRKEAGMVTSTSRPPLRGGPTSPASNVTPSRRTCMPETKPVPKIFTPGKSQLVAGGVGVVHTEAACGTRALGRPPELGTITSEIWVGLNREAVLGNKLTRSVVAVPDMTTKA